MFRGTYMNRNKNIDPEKLYISKRLEEKLQKISRYPLTVMEAPMGYGKTTSLRSFVKGHRGFFVWLSVLDSSQEYFWESFCRLFRQIDSDVADQLLAAGYPKDNVMAGMTINLMNNANYPGDVLFVIDDYHLVAGDTLNHFFELVARDNNPNIHFVMLGRSRFNQNREELKLKNRLLIFSEDDFKLNQQECGQYIENCGLKLGIDEIELLYRYSEGWISALYMIVLGYASTGEIRKPANVNELFETAIYSHYDDNQRDLLLRACLFRKFSLDQIRTVRPSADTGEILDDIVASNGFIRYEADQKRYYINGLFSKFLKEKLTEESEEYRKEIYRNAADWYANKGKYFRATLYYHRGGFYDEMLKSFEMDKGKGFSGKSGQVMVEAYNSCPPEIRRNHPMALMICAVQLSMTKQTEGFNGIMAELRSIFEEQSSADVRNDMVGEYYILMGFVAYNNLRKIVAYQEKARKHIRGCSAIEGGKGSWTFGLPSVLYMFYREEGSLDELVKLLYDSRENYYSLTDNNGRGGEYVMDAEACFMRGNPERAEILSYKALTAAERYGQIGIAICAYFLQARIFLLNGDTEKGLQALAKIHETVVESERYTFVHSADLCRAFIYAVYNQDKLIPKWVKKGSYDDCGVYHPVESFLYVIFGRLLINQEEYSRLLGMEDRLYESAAEFPNLIAEIYMDIYTATAFEHLEMREDAEVRFRKAVEKSHEDEIYMPFIENYKGLRHLFRDLKFDGRQAEFVEKCRELYKKYEKSLNIRLNEEGSSPINMLTKREQEISLLVAEGKTNMEIARQLNVAEITVKKSLSNIYARLGINNRAALTKKISIG